MATPFQPSEHHAYYAEDISTAEKGLGKFMVLKRNISCPQVDLTAFYRAAARGSMIVPIYEHASQERFRADPEMRINDDPPSDLDLWPSTSVNGGARDEGHPTNRPTGLPAIPTTP